MSPCTYLLGAWDSAHSASSLNWWRDKFDPKTCNWNIVWISRDNSFGWRTCWFVPKLDQHFQMKVRDIAQLVRVRGKYVGFHRRSYMSLSVIMNSSISVVCMPFSRSPSSVNLYVVFRLLLSRYDDVIWYDVIEEKRRDDMQKGPKPDLACPQVTVYIWLLVSVPITPCMHAPSLQVWLDAWRVLGLVKCYMCYNCNKWCLQ